MVEHQPEDEKLQQQNPYMLFLLVLVFFLTGLVGFLICHILKKKGYRCRTSPEELDPEMKEDLSREQDLTDEISNEDTVERIVKCIIQNEANAEALKQMLGDTEGEVTIGPNLCPHRESQDAGPTHHHTVHLGSTQAPCIHCTRKKRSLLQRMGRSKESRGKPHPGEITVFSVGRFRVTHVGKKSSIQLSQDDPNIGSDPVSSDNAEEQQAAKSINGVTTRRASVGLSQNGPELVGLTKLESENYAESRLEDKNGLKSSGGKTERILAKINGIKDRRSSAPEQTVAQRERVDILQLRKKEQSNKISESTEEQVTYTASCQGHMEKQMCVISVDGKPVTALLDSGSVVTLVKGDFVNPAKLHPSAIGVICIHGDTHDFQTDVVEFDSPWGTVTHSVSTLTTS